MSIRFQDISTSTAVDSDDKVLVTDGSTEFLATLETVYNAIKRLLPIETLNVAAGSSSDILIAENTAGVVFTSGAADSGKSAAIFNATSGGTVTVSQLVNSSAPTAVVTPSTGRLTVTSTGTSVVKCMVLYWNGSVSV